MEDVILERWSDENGDLFRVGRIRGKYYIETIDEAWASQTGTVHRKFVTGMKALGFDPDPMGELEYTVKLANWGINNGNVD